MSGWTLGIDFGTSYTVAVVAADGTAHPVDAESNGRDRMPSAVFLTEEGELLVGTAAQGQARFAPERFEPTPKRSIGEGEVFLGDRLVAVEDLIAAVLRRVYKEACRQQGEVAPEIVRLTCPVEWAEPRRAVLLEAAARAGLPAPSLVDEPVAAAVRIALQVTPPGERIAVYDFGGGTFDAAVLLRTPSGFEVAGPPSGRDPLGGEDIDQRIIGYLGDLLAGEHPEDWAKLLEPPDTEWRGYAADLRGEVQRAKETLSDVKAAQLWVPGIRRDVQLTRDELDRMIGADIEATVDALETALADASVAAGELAGLYLVGGSSRIPLVADKIWRRLGVRPSVQDNPKSVVALGAATLDVTRSASASASATAPRPIAGSRFGARLTAVQDRAVWPQGCYWSGQVLIDRPFGSPLTVRLRDDPSRGMSTVALAQEALERRRSRTPGFVDQGTGPARVLGAGEGIERRFSMRVGGAPLAMIEQYLVLGTRALVVIYPAEAEELASSVSLAEPSGAVGAPPARFEASTPEGWVVIEELSLWNEQTNSSMRVSRMRLPDNGDSVGQTWETGELERVRRLPGGRIVEQAATTVLGVPGQIVTCAWRQGRVPMVTKLGVGVADGVGLSLSIELPHRDQDRFPAMARSVSLLPD